ncbi:MAG: hypothetical protein IJ434_01545 [Alistipes sp.]|nr:hypothetical protein [Alistipes sp.]
MSKLLKILCIVALFCGTTSCEKVKSLVGIEESQGVVGGYSKPRNLTDEDIALFEQATAQLQGVEYKPMNVATQIVAGVNYRYLCKARRIDESGKKGKRFYAAIVVYKPLAGQGEPRILSIEKQSR